MKMSRSSVASFLWIFLSLTSAEDINDQCEVYNETMICTCFKNEELLLPEYSYEKITSLFISTCSSANLKSMSLARGVRLKNIAVHNISNTLIFESSLYTESIERLELVRIRKIPLITHASFKIVRNIELILMEDSTIENIDEDFSEINVTNFVMKGVNIKKMDGWKFAGRGKSLKIIDCEFRDVHGNLNFAYFSDINISKSRFEFEYPADLWIEGISASVKNSIFTNITMNLVTSDEIKMNGTCADGKSSLRLSSSKIESYGNKLPTEIIYSKNKSDNMTFLIKNNTVCIAGDCGCPKSNNHIREPFPNIYFIVMMFAFIFSYSQNIQL